MARCEKEKTVNIPKIYTIGHRENTGVFGDSCYGGTPCLGKRLYPTLDRLKPKQ